MTDQQTLAQMVRAKYPGAYDDMDDQKLEAAITAKFPGVYDDIPKTQSAQAKQPQQAAQAPARSAGTYAGDVVSSLGGKLADTVKAGAQIGANALDPRNIATGSPFLASTLRSVGGSILQGVKDEFHKAADAFQKGDKAAVAGHAAAMVPVIGPMLDRWVQDYKDGKTEDIVSDLLLFTLPGAASKALPKSMTVLPSVRSMPAADAQAVDFVASRGVPVSAGTATGNPLVMGLEKNAADTSLIGGQIAKGAKEATRQGFATLGDSLSAKANNGGVAHTMETAGVDAARRAADKVAGFAQSADQAYTNLRRIEANNQVIGVDLKAARANLKPIYDDLNRQREILGSLPPGPTSRALVALDNLMSNKAPVAKLTDVDAALSELKSVLRSAESSNALDRGTGILAQAVKALDEQVVGAAKASPGRGAYENLMRGREATIKKYAADDARELLEGADSMKSSRIASQLMAPKDANMQALREVQREVPEALPHIGRAYLEDLMQKATSGDLKDVYADWQKLGAGTKKTVFADALKRDGNYLRDLDNFFLALKRSTANVNTSGTAAQVVNAGKGAAMAVGIIQPAAWVVAGLQELGATGLTKALNSPSVVRALTRGLNVRVSQGASRVAAAASINAALKAEGLPALSFASDKEREER